ncbi:hypothetical protein GcM3_036040, partial [Golovinomyces cichoracearum]
MSNLAQISSSPEHMGHNPISHFNHIHTDNNLTISAPK